MKLSRVLQLFGVAILCLAVVTSVVWRSDEVSVLLWVAIWANVLWISLMCFALATLLRKTNE